MRSISRKYLLASALGFAATVTSLVVPTQPAQAQ